MVKKQILVVEDNRIVAKNIQNRLENSGYTVPAIISSGEEAVRKTAEIQPDLVLMDIKLEGIVDGVEAANQIKNRYNIPVIYLTAYGDDETLRRAKITEPYGYILKPFVKRELFSNIEMAFYKHSIDSKLRDNEEWLSTTLNSIGDAVIATDKQENITFINPAAETLTGWEQKDALGKPLKTIFNIINEKTRTPSESLAKIAIQQNKIINLESISNILITKDGKEKPIDDSVAPIKDHKGNVTGSVLVFQDITKRRKIKEELKKYRHHLEELVEKRTVELTATNKKLQQEVTNRKEAEEEAEKTRDDLQNIINSASEVIISIDNKNRVAAWNRTVELLTGYKEKEVIGKHVTKLPVFDKPAEFQDNLKSIHYGKKPRFNDLVLKTKSNTKKIIRTSCSFIKGNGEYDAGVLLVGTNITNDLESHGKLLKGGSYLISDKDNKSALDLFAALSISDYEGLFVTRANPEIIKDMSLLRENQVVLLSQKNLGKFENISDLDALITKIEKFGMNNRNSVILLDGVHYLLTRYSFEKFIEALYQIREMVANTNSILLLRIDPLLLDVRQMAVLENELQSLPSRKIDDVEIGDELYAILEFICTQNQNNTEVSFKKVSKEFSIVSKTTANRLRMMENKELIFIKKRGRLKTLHVSQKGKTLLHKKQVV